MSLSLARTSGLAIATAALVACASTGGKTAASSGGGAGGAPGATSSAGTGGIVFTGPVGSGGTCGAVPPPTTPTCDGLDAGPPPTFAHDIAPIVVGCTGDICHGAPTYDTLVGVPTNECCDHRDLVAPGDPAKSYLVTKLSGEHLCAGERMPFREKPLPAAEQATIVAWICGGALQQ